MILVVGSTGSLGSEICRCLAAVGRPVRGLIRATSAAEKVGYLADIGVETLIGDLRDPVSLKAACEGVQAVIATVPLVDLVQPEGSTSNNSEGDILQGVFDLITAAVKAGAQQFILLSGAVESDVCQVYGAGQTIESALVNSGLSYTILQTGVFMETMFCPELGFDYLHGRAVIYGDGHKEISFISIPDAAQYAVESLMNPLVKNSVLQISASPDCSLLEVVRMFEESSGQSFQLTFVPAAELKAQRAATQDPRQVSLILIMQALANGLRLNSARTRTVFKFHLTSMDDYARQVVSDRGENWHKDFLTTGNRVCE